MSTCNESTVSETKDDEQRQEVGHLGFDCPIHTTTMYSVRVEAEQLQTGVLQLDSFKEFPSLAGAEGSRGNKDSEGKATDAGPYTPETATDIAAQELTFQEHMTDAEGHGEDFRFWDTDANSVAFSAGNPRVERITGVVHLYREIPATSTETAADNTPDKAAAEQASQQQAAGAENVSSNATQRVLSMLARSSQAGAQGSPSKAGSSQATPDSKQTEAMSHLPVARSPVLCCLAIPADMSLAEFCTWCGAYLKEIRSIRVFRREARSRVVCMVLLAFGEQAKADEYFENYNLKPFSSLEPEIVCRLVWVREVQVMKPTDTTTTHPPARVSQQGTSPVASHAAQHAQHAVSSSGGGLEETGARMRPVRTGAASTSRPSTPRRLSAASYLESPKASRLAATLEHATNRSVASHDSKQPGHEIQGTELPTCPVCLDRLDEHVSGVVTTVCNHQFHSECLLKWGDTSCPVCRYCSQAHANASHCVTCNASHDLWICLICGNVGCGRYKAGHAYNHWKATNHCYALELETQRVWDYAGDNYVHRLIQSKTDGKLVEVPTPGPNRRHQHTTSRARSGSMGGGRHRHSCGADTEEDDDGGGGDASEWGGTQDDEFKQVLLASKLDHIADEYNHLLTSQLDSQRSYFEGLLAQQAATFSQRLAAADAAVASHQAAASSAVAAAKEADRKRQALEQKLADLKSAHDKLTKEYAELQSISDNLAANSAGLKQQIETYKAQVADKDKDIAELQEQVRDLMVFIEAGRMIQGSEELKDGAAVAAPAATTRSRVGKARRGR